LNVPSQGHSVSGSVFWFMCYHYHYHYHYTGWELNFPNSGHSVLSFSIIFGVLVITGFTGSLYISILVY